MSGAWPCLFKTMWCDSFFSFSVCTSIWQFPLSLNTCQLLRQNDGEEYQPYVIRILELKQLSLQPGHHRDRPDLPTNATFSCQYDLKTLNQIKHYKVWPWYILKENRLDDWGLETMVLQMHARDATSWVRERITAPKQSWTRLWLLWQENVQLPITESV